jgi:Na+-transporting methylmalonyl-CoA/oxaloacetate decarboxylase gamma subunit
MIIILDMRGGMKNKILCLLALLLSAITYMGDIFATEKPPVEIKKMSSFENLCESGRLAKVIHKAITKSSNNKDNKLIINNKNKVEEALKLTRSILKQIL